MPKVHIDDYEDDEFLDEMPPRERIQRRPKDEKDKGHMHEKSKKKHHDSEAANRKEYHDE